jgi:hypothetical protein
VGRLIARKGGLTISMPRVAAATAILAVIVGGLPRILLAAGTLPNELRGFVWSDIVFTYFRGLSGHRLPYVDTPFEYPPLVGALAASLSLVAEGATTYAVLWTAILALAAGICGHMLARAAGRRAVAYWSLTPQLLLLSTINFDVIPTMLLVVAAVTQRAGRELWAAAALATGTAAKLFPLASAPLAISRSRRRAAATGCFLAMLAAFYLPTLSQPFSSASGVVRYAAGIGSNIDSVWGILERALAATGVSSTSLVILAFSMGGLALTYLFHVVPVALRAKDPAVGFALATVVLLFWSRLYSPQYSLWLLPFYALIPLRRSSFVVLTVADIGVFFTIYPLTLVPRSTSDPGSAALLGALAAFVVLRHVALTMAWRDLVRLAREVRGATTESPQSP